MLDSGIAGHSVFTGRLIAALEEVQDFITGRELGLKLQMQVYGDAAARGHTHKNRWQREIYGTGDFVFAPDLSKRETMEKERVDRLEAEVAELERLRALAMRRDEEARLRELERRKCEKEAALKLAKIRQEEAQKEALRDAREQEGSAPRCCGAGTLGKGTPGAACLSQDQSGCTKTRSLEL